MSTPQTKSWQLPGAPRQPFLQPWVSFLIHCCHPWPPPPGSPRVLQAAHCTGLPCLFVTDVTSACPARPGARLAGQSAWGSHRLHQPRAAQATLTRGKPRLGVT